MPILIDASVFCAYANIRDVHHEKAKKILKEIMTGKHGSAITTDYIFDETLTVIMRKINRKSAVEFGDILLNSEILIGSIDPIIFQKTWEIFQKIEIMGFTDCSSIAFMGIFEISKIATFDKEFKKIETIRVLDE